MGYLHVQVDYSQANKKFNPVSGDTVDSFRFPEATYVLLVDGIGSGVKANLYATMVSARLRELISGGAAMRKAFESVLNTMHNARGTDMPYAVFTLLRILNNGETAILGYEMPPPIFTGKYAATVVKQRNFSQGYEVVSESNLFLSAGEGVIVYSDGVSMAGIGPGMPMGWGTEGICDYINHSISAKTDKYSLHSNLIKKSRQVWGETCGDDCTAIGIFCRVGNELKVFAGPPASSKDDFSTVKDFLSGNTKKVVCGATTSQIVARIENKEISVNSQDSSLISPPGYVIEGIDLATEGAVTLNQVYNILDEDYRSFDHNCSVTQLHKALVQADKIVFIVGLGKNKGHAELAFRRQGILPREKIISLIAAQLQAKGRLVEIKYV